MRSREGGSRSWLRAGGCRGVARARSMRGQVGATCLGDELDVLPLDVLDDEDLHLREEVERELVDGVAQDRLLDQQHVAARLGDLLAHVENVLALLRREGGEGSAGRGRRWCVRAVCVSACLP